MPKKDAPTPATPSMAYEAMQPMWRKVETLLAGTDAMRAAGEEYLPRHEEEGQHAYQERLSRATLLNMTQLTLDSWVGRPFGDPVKVGEDVPEQIKDLLDNVDMQGNDITVFCRTWFRDGLAKAFSHVLVDFPRARPREDGLPRTLEDDRRDNLRPYLVHIKPENLIFASAEVINGVEVVTHVRIREEHVQREGWGEKVVVRIRVIDPGLVSIYEERIDPKTKKPVYVLVDQYPYSLDFVPIVTFYADRQSFMIGKPPLNDLADLNIAHWQSSSDQTAVLTVARFPILAVSGTVGGDKLTVGPNQWLNTPDVAGRFYYVEHTGRAIAAGRQDLLDKEETMAEYGAVFLKRRPGGASATARALDSAETTSPLQDMAIRFQSSLQQALVFIGAWMGVTADQVGTMTISTDFGITDQDGKQLDSLKEARKNRDISRARYLKELHRFGVLSDDFNFEQNEEELEEESVEMPSGETDEDLDPAASE
jgi:hypothetical protein